MFYGTRRFITVATKALHRFLPWAKPIQSTPSTPYSHNINFNIILLCVPAKFFTHFMYPPSLIWLYRSWSPSLCSFLQPPVTSSLIPRPQSVLRASLGVTPSAQFAVRQCQQLGPCGVHLTIVELEGMWKEAIAACCNILTRYLPGGTKESREKPEAGTRFSGDDLHPEPPEHVTWAVPLGRGGRHRVSHPYATTCNASRAYSVGD
jgi:hypothetical protein